MNVLAEVEDTAKLDAFRDEVRTWIKENFPESLKTKLEEYFQSMPKYQEGPDWKLWKERVAAKGWGTPGWPKAYGGGGLPTVQARIVRYRIRGQNRPLISRPNCEEIVVWPDTPAISTGPERESSNRKNPTVLVEDYYTEFLR